MKRECLEDVARLRRDSFMGSGEMKTEVWLRRVRAGRQRNWVWNRTTEAGSAVGTPSLPGGGRYRERHFE